MIFVAQKSGQRTDVVIDLDGTIADDKFADIRDNVPKTGVKEALQRFLDAGLRVIIFTCRLNKKGRPVGEAMKDKRIVEEWLAKNEIPYTEIDEGYNGKPHGVVYIDNKAMHYGGSDDWETIANRILGGQNG